MTAPTVAPEITATDLRNATEKLRTHGWGRGQFWDRDTGCLCLVGAITTAVYGRVPTVPGIAAKPTWKPSWLLRPDQAARAKAAEKTVTRYIRRHDLLGDGGEPDYDDDGRGYDDGGRGYDAVDWNDNKCERLDEAVALLLAVADELTAVA